MAGTYLDIQNRIASDLRRDDLATDIANAVNDAIKFWEGHAFTFNEKQYKLVTVQGQEYYSLSYQLLPAAQFPSSQNISTIPTNIDGSALATGELMLEIETMTNKPFTTGLPYPVTGRSMAWFDKNQANPLVAQGLPEFYAIFDGGMRIYPVPNGLHTLTPSGLVRLAPYPLANNTDTNAWLTEGEMLIRAQAKAFLYRDVIEDDEGYEKAILAIYGDDSGNSYIPGALDQLKRKADALVMTGRVEAWSL